MSPRSQSTPPPTGPGLLRLQTRRGERRQQTNPLLHHNLEQRNGRIGQTTGKQSPPVAAPNPPEWLSTPKKYCDWITQCPAQNNVDVANGTV